MLGRRRKNGAEGVAPHQPPQQLLARAILHRVALQPTTNV